MNRARSLQLWVWVAVFFASFAFVMSSWGWNISPLAMCLTTFGGFTTMLFAYKFGIDRCLPSH